ncbi:MAG: MBL fold metallo-hydrolase [Candidatus Babeliales bacterium]
MQNKPKTRPHVHNDRFYNKPNEYVHHVLLPSALMYAGSWIRRWFGPKIKKEDWVIKQSPLERSDQPVITWIGHATFLIQIGGINILTDPLFSSPSLLFRRILPPGIALKKLPKPDVLLISHNHPDHMSASCLRALKKRQPRVLVPLKLGNWFSSRGYKAVHEHDWWQSYSIPSRQEGEPITFTFLPSWHWSQRNLFDRNKTLWGSWLLTFKDHSIYFAGDTSYAGHFKEISEHFPNIHTALLPIGPCEPKRWMEHVHMSAQHTVQAFKDLKAKRMIPMHWGTFHFGVDHFATPLEHLQEAWQKAGLALEHLIIAKVGQRI